MICSQSQPDNTRKTFSNVRLEIFSNHQYSAPVLIINEKWVWLKQRLPNMLKYGRIIISGKERSVTEE